MKDQIRKILSDAFDEVSPMLTEKVSYSDELILRSAAGGLLDSMSLVAFISSIEITILDTLDKNLSIVSEKAFSQQQSPFRTMETLGSFIEELLEETEK